ncbi:MAG TPA: ABC transporter permease subunit [Vicinamibacterales bacterium]|nr:ABC transporter permease subunit [Vicinamibacterales bacterium]
MNPSSRAVVVTLAVVVFALCSLAPVAYLLAVALADLDPAGLWLDARQRQLLWNTGLLGVGTATLATVIGAPLGVALAHVTLPLRSFLRLALAMPLLLPPYVVALVWTYLCGGRGVIASLAGRDVLSGWTYSLPAAILVLSLVYYPLSMLVTEVALRRIDGRLEEAAVVSAPPLLVLRRITLPLAAPGVLAAALVIFVLSVSEFGVPGLLRVRVYTTEVFTAFAALYDSSRAMLLAVPLLLVCLIVAFVAVALAGERLVSTRRGHGTRPVLLEGWRVPAAVAAILAVGLSLGVPLTVLVREALSVGSLSAVVEGSGRAISNSLVLAAIGATAVVAVALWLGYARARSSGCLGRLADVLFVVAFAVPSTIVGVGLIGIWNRPGLVGTVYGTDVMLILGYLARFVPVAALAIAAVTRYVPVSQEEAAAVGGAGWLRTMTRIVVPQIRLGLLTAWIIAFVLAFGELGVSILVAPPGEATLPIRIYTIIANTPPSHVAVLALLQTAVVLSPLAVLALALPLRASAGARRVSTAAGAREAR